MLTVGEVVEGKVTGIASFGAFVALPEGKSGLVHISEIANTYVSNVADHVSEGQTVKVRVIGINEAGKINLSIKQAEPPQRRSAPPRRGGEPKAPNPQASAASADTPQAPADSGFEDKLKHFMQDSDSRISSSRLYADRKTSYRRRRD